MRLAERGEVSSRDLDDVEADAFAGHAALEVHREEAVVAAGEDRRRDVRPVVETAGLLEGDVGLGALVGLTGGGNLRRNVVHGACRPTWMGTARQPWTRVIVSM